MLRAVPGSIGRNSTDTWLWRWMCLIKIFLLPVRGSMGIAIPPVRYLNRSAGDGDLAAGQLQGIDRQGAAVGF
jgi:hypothetical protein